MDWEDLSELDMKTYLGAGLGFLGAAFVLRLENVQIAFDVLPFYWKILFVIGCIIVGVVMGKVMLRDK